MAKVESISKFGFVAEGKKYRYDEVTVDRATIVPGAEIELGKGVNSTPFKHTLLSVDDPMGCRPVDIERAKVFTPKYGQQQAPTNGMSKEEWRLKDERISRQGCLQIAVQVCGDFDQACILADKMLTYINKNTPK